MHDLGLVLEGGSFRGIFTAGVLDYLIEKDVKFPYVIGVSAGSCNAVNYIAGQKGRTQKVITHENADAFYGMKQLYHNRKILNLDKMLYEYSYSQFPLDFDTFFGSGVESEFVAINCETGEAEYLIPDGREDQLLEITKASCSVPMLCNPVRYDDKLFLDGSIANSIPFEKALEKCKKVVVVLTRMEEENPTDYSKMKTMINICYRFKYPKLAEAMINRKANYLKQLDRLYELEKEGKAFIIRPTAPGIGHFENNVDKINEFYRQGYENMSIKFEELLEYMK